MMLGLIWLAEVTVHAMLAGFAAHWSLETPAIAALAKSVVFLAIHCVWVAAGWLLLYVVGVKANSDCVGAVMVWIVGTDGGDGAAGEIVYFVGSDSRS